MMAGKPPKSAPEPETDFGFARIPEHEKEARIRGVFESVAGRYDLMNDLMSGGVHRFWKAAMIDWLRPFPGMKALDVAGGTGDIAFRILDRLARRPGGRSAEVLVCDINAAMLEEGRRRAAQRAREGKPVPAGWLCGNAESLPVPDASQDACTIAFGIRNVTHVDRALGEAFRVLKPGGRFLCLEFSAVNVPGLDALYDAWSFHIIPRIGQAVTGDGEAYRYLVESIRKFPDQERFAAMITDAGFSRTRVRNMSGGIVALHSAFKI
jgi:demethylmenaquinone methyltransferase / 2-methoxy-6-polyprenyl-1,4-benzoquinol methylase